MKKVLMALPIVLILIVMILSLTCPISYSYHTSYARIDGVGSKLSKTDYAEYNFRDDLGISSGGAIAIVVIFCTLAIAGIVFLYKAKDLDRGYLSWNDNCNDCVLNGSVFYDNCLWCHK